MRFLAKIIKTHCLSIGSCMFLRIKVAEFNFCRCRVGSIIADACVCACESKTSQASCAIDNSSMAVQLFIVPTHSMHCERYFICP